MRKILILTFIMLFIMNIGSFADVDVMVKGEKLIFEKEPFIINGKSYLPLRQLSNAVDAEIT